MWFETSSFWKGLTWSTSFSSPLFHLSIELGLRHLKNVRNPEQSKPDSRDFISKEWTDSKSVVHTEALLSPHGNTFYTHEKNGASAQLPTHFSNSCQDSFSSSHSSPKTGKGGINHLIGHSLRLGPLVADGPGCHMLDSSCPSAEALLLFQFLCQRSAGQS